jgi:hypothetical protein
MYDPEKSDSGIVAAKLANKAGRPVTEPAEPRPGTKGNEGQQSTHRAQYRAEEEGTVHRTSPPYHRRYTPDGVLRASAQSRPRRGWRDLAGLRGRP